MKEKLNIKTVDEYFMTLPENIQYILEDLRETIKSAAPKAEETISYQLPTFKYFGSLVSYGMAKTHCSFYVLSQPVIQMFKEELKPYNTSTGTIRFQPDKPLPKALIKKLVKARMKENEALVKAKAKNK